MKKKYLILDCFVDEPTCLGVPPFISPYPRYIFGALLDAGISETDISYLTIDRLRENRYLLDSLYHCTLIIGGAVVPGRYLGSRIGTLAEIMRIIECNEDQNFAVGGLISHVMKDGTRADIILKDIEKFAHSHARGEPADSCRSTEEIARWSLLGAEMVMRHPSFPNVICEIETGRGCPREKHCSFCTEGLLNRVESRDTADVIGEVDRLIRCGISRFRIGRQADILQYRSELNAYKNGFPRPNPGAAIELFSELGDRKTRGDISVLNIDNANPGTIASFPEESIRILEAIVRAVTPGDTMALGIESFDRRVIEKNCLKAGGEDSLRAVSIINQVGGARINGIPVLLPGVNLVHGLAGESTETFGENYRWLVKIRDMGLLLKRINIRQVQHFPGTPISGERPPSRIVFERFKYYRERIRDEIEHYMLEKIYPVGTLIRDIQIMDERAGYSYGKQIASYAITLKFPLQLLIKTFHEAVVIGHRERSLMALPVPIAINSLPQRALELLPGIGRKLATEIILARPFRTVPDAREFIRTLDKRLTAYMSL